MNTVDHMIEILKHINVCVCPRFAAARTTTHMLAAVLVAFVLVALLTRDGRAQSIAMSQAPYYAGEPIIVQVQFSDLDADAEPSVEYSGSPSDGVRVEGPQVSKSSMSQTTIINGRMSSRESQNYTFNFRIVPAEPGVYEIGPFTYTLDGVSETINAVRAKVEALEPDPDVRIAIELERNSVYVGEQVPVTVRWSFSGPVEAANYAFNALQIRSPLFDMFDFQQPEPQTRQRLTIATAQGEVQIDGQISEETDDGRDFIVVTGQLVMVPKQTGKFNNLGVSCRTEKVTRWRRGMFGDLSPARSTPAIAAGEPVSIEVKPLPTDNRPASFSGAVGRAFTIATSANRTVVRVGDPISLDIKLRSSGSIETLSLPNLNASGLPAEQFQTPEEPPAGVVADGVKQFQVDVRVKEQSVQQIPAVEFSWFDPVEETYKTTESKPIALQVLEGKIVSAADVVSSAPSAAKAESEQTSGANDELTGSKARADSLAAVNANLAIATDVETMLNSASEPLPSWLAWFVYAAGVAVLMASLLMRRRMMQSPELQQRGQLRKQSLAALASAKQLPPRESAERAAGELRKLLPAAELDAKLELDRMISKLDAIAYAPSGGEKSGEVRRLLDEAETLVREALL